MAVLTGRRTGVTNLTDAELTLLDIAAMYVARGSMYADLHFVERWNRPSHGLDNRTLLRTLARFEAEGLIIAEPVTNPHGRPDVTIRLTPAGGALWELERKPDWLRYVEDVYRRSWVAIYGYSREACERYFEVACEAQLFRYEGGRIRQAVANRRLVYWRPAQPVYLLGAKSVEDQTDCDTDWAYFESRRTWWRFPDEIGTLRQS